MQDNKKMINFYEKKTSKVVDLGCLLLLVSNSTANTADCRKTQTKFERVNK